MQQKILLIVAHSPSANTKVLADALYRGATHDDIKNVKTQLCKPFDCDAQDILNCDALIIFTTENFGAMCGAIKDFFERVYYPCLNDEIRNQGKPYALVIRAGIDGSGTNIGVHKIINGLKWKEAQKTLLCKGDFQESFIQQCEELGLTIAASLDNDIL